MPEPHLLNVAYNRKPADTLITGARLVNVLTGETYQAGVALAGDRIAAVGDVADRRGPDTRVIDADGLFLTPGLIDGHVHIECSKLSVTMFAGLVSRYGTTSAVSGLDQILVVAGLDGVREFLAEADRSTLRIFWGAPAKAPYTVPESTVGHRFGPAEHAEAQNWPECTGLWETVQEFIEHGDPEVLEAIRMAFRNRLPVFGCAPMADDRRIAGLAAAGVRLDHESYSAEEALTKLRNGIHVIIRESTAAPFLNENIQILTRDGAAPGRVAFCTDDVTATDLLGRGHLDHLVRMAIEAGVDPVTAIQMATINCASMYGIDHQVGAVAPGRFADMLLVEDLSDFRATVVIAGGEVVARDGELLTEPVAPERSARLRDTIVLREIAPDDLAPVVTTDRAEVPVLAMSLSADVAFVRGRKDAVLPVVDGRIVADTVQDVLYVAVAERYGKTDHLPVAFVHGFGLANGAIATSAAPDDNNIVCVGADPGDMAVAINAITGAGGGQVVVRDGHVVDMLPLPIGGIVADLPPEEMSRREQELDEHARELGSGLPSPFGQLIFLSITAIPEYAITDLGLIDCVELKPINPVLDAEEAS
ncbi:adenine deaminase C-terminal domain-containing protein [Pseudonocardia spinosispora]|uniref:adenine deaminase C-terminal domain-containing protein n=1 Tax=Pseudonocardia spinosispora TaxID=103441 RepID=UPI0003FD7899|nr:adenine deaminase C-terminal domain-containing protein [Pseudonocardia spinosispora]